jgi:F-type H+-transporting ATPase subunit a
METDKSIEAQLKTEESNISSDNLLENNHSNTKEEIVHESTLYAEPIFHISDFKITNSLFTSWIVVFILIIISLVLRIKIKKIPKGIQNFFEIILNGALSLCDQITNDRKITNKIFPLAFSVFLFILINNWLGILPFGGFGLVENLHGKSTFIPFIRSGTADLNTSLALAVIVVAGSNIFGIIFIGLWKVFNKYISLVSVGHIFTKIKKDPTIIIVSPINIFVGLLEVIGEFAKVASLSFRLFGNVFAGEVLLLSMSVLMAYILPIPFLFLEVFVGFIQAFIFSVLLIVYFTIAAQDHEHKEEVRDS